MFLGKNIQVCSWALMKEMNIVIYGKSHDVKKTLRYLWVNINQNPTRGNSKEKMKVPVFR